MNEDKDFQKTLNDIHKALTKQYEQTREKNIALTIINIYNGKYNNYDEYMQEVQIEQQRYEKELMNSYLDPQKNILRVELTIEPIVLSEAIFNYIVSLKQPVKKDVDWSVNDLIQEFIRNGKSYGGRTKYMFEYDYFFKAIEKIEKLLKVLDSLKPRIKLKNSIIKNDGKKLNVSFIESGGYVVRGSREYNLLKWWLEN